MKMGLAKFIANHTASPTLGFHKTHKHADTPTCTHAHALMSQAFTTIAFQRLSSTNESKKVCRL